MDILPYYSESYKAKAENTKQFMSPMHGTNTIHFHTHTWGQF